MGERLTKTERIRHANAVIEEISKVGRRFFWSERHGHVSRFDATDAGRLYLLDKCTNERVHLIADRPWPTFTEGGTLRRLIEDLADYIRTGKAINPRHFGPWPRWICDGDLWGYGEAMGPLRERLLTSPAVAAPAARPAEERTDG